MSLKVPESSLSFISFLSSSPRPIIISQRLGKQLCMHPTQSISLCSPWKVYFSPKKLLSPRLFLDLSLPSLHMCHPRVFFGRKSLTPRSVTQLYIDILLFLARPGNGRAALTFSLNSEPHYFSFLSRLADLEAARRGWPNK